MGELEDHWLLDAVTRAALALSVLALAAAAVTFALVRALRGLRNSVHLQLSLSLLVAHAAFLLGMEPSHGQASCVAVAVVLHFSLLAAFSWMLLEGLLLLVLLVLVFVPAWLRLRHLLLLGYGLPALTVATAAAANPGGYGTARYCWLSLERGFRWSFQGPVCVIIAVNAVVLVITFWKLVQKFNDINPNMGHLQKMRSAPPTGPGCAAPRGDPLEVTSSSSNTGNTRVSRNQL
ncbi:adhesion G protein-coupled receptor E5-like isoform X2 [Melopsittacus undulatus]|uniref:adhesion G protein-coupled receptor E5-like isoform X2 n=1 Tax=Melopsittacus undulatus TaxID=13146 RepID=UPI00146E2341|nr:adhesion G protein-coupled receptor E5-like isoform X2 [Melopsittacus undulatus]